MLHQHASLNHTNQPYSWYKKYTQIVPESMHTHAYARASIYVICTLVWITPFCQLESKAIMSMVSAWSSSTFIKLNPLRPVSNGQ